MGFALFYDGVHRFFADGADRGHPKADALVAVFIQFHREAGDGVIHVRRQHRDVVLAAEVNVAGHSRGRADETVHHGGHELSGVVVLQPRGVHGVHRVGRGVGLVKRVAGKAFHLVKDVLRRLYTDAVVHSATHAQRLIAVHKRMSLLVHDGLFLFAHGAPEQVAAPQGVARQVAGDLHDLLLVHDAAVGYIQYGG